MIRISGVAKNYGRFSVLKEVNAELTAGQVVGIIGPNGCGKTTLIKCILGLTSLSAGEIAYNGRNISVAGESSYRADFGYMPQVGRYPENMKVSQLFSMLRDMREGSYTETDEELMKSYGIEKIYDKSLGSLSGGTVQKVSAAIAFLFAPKVLILDEPTAGLDPVAAEILKSKIHRDSAHRLILITSHILNDLDELASHLLFLHEGKVRFFEQVAKLKETHGETRLGKIISSMMLKDQLSSTNV